jgi:hypothetical protein
LILRFPEEKKWNYLRNGILCSLIAFVFGIILAKSKSWHVWEFENDTVQVLFIGLWEADYYQKFNISGSIVELPIHTTINESWIVPPELHHIRNLILLANFMKLGVLFFSMEAAFVSWMKALYPDFLRSCYKISTFFLILCSACTVVAVSWNHAVDFYVETTLDFPGTFPVKKEALTKKHFSYVLPLGVLTAIFSLFGATIFINKMWSIEKGNEMKPKTRPNMSIKRTELRASMFGKSASHF